jgi:hypothetical protein
LHSLLQELRLNARDLVHAARDFERGDELARESRIDLRYQAERADYLAHELDVSLAPSLAPLSGPEKPKR